MTALTRPAPSEHADYYSRYIAMVAEGDLLEALENQTETTLELLDSLTEDQGDIRYAPDKWTVRQVIGHMADAERVFGLRALWGARGAAAPQPGFDENAWAELGEHNDRALADVVEEFAAVREATLALARSMTGGMGARVCNMNGTDTTVRAIFHIIAGHELHHVGILRERYLK